MEKSKKEILLEAQQECNLTVAQKRIEVMKALSELEEIRGTDDYAVTITEALKEFATPLPLAFFNQVLPDSALLVSVRKILRGETGQPPVIEELKASDDKTKIVLKLIQKQAA